MGLEGFEIERDVERLYVASGANPRIAGLLPEVLRALADLRFDGLMDVRFVQVANDAPPARLRIFGSGISREYVIEVSENAKRRRPPTAVIWGMAHEAGEWRTHSLGLADDGDALRERLANNFAGALIVPAVALELAWDCWGFDIPTLAEQFSTTGHVVALRLGEVFGHGVAVIDPRAEPLWGRPYVQRRGWLAAAPVGDNEIIRLAWSPNEAMRHGWDVARLRWGVRVLHRVSGEDILEQIQHRFFI